MGFLSVDFKILFVSKLEQLHDPCSWMKICHSGFNSIRGCCSSMSPGPTSGKDEDVFPIDMHSQSTCITPHVAMASHADHRQTLRPLT